MLCHLGSAHTIGGTLEVKHSYVISDLARRTTRSLSNRAELMNHPSGKESSIARIYGMKSMSFLSPCSTNKGFNYFWFIFKTKFAVCHIDSVR